MGHWPKSPPSVHKIHWESGLAPPWWVQGVGLGQRKGTFLLLQTVLSSEGLGWGQGWGGSLPLLMSSGASGVLSQQPLCTILLQGKSLYLPPGAQLPLPHPKLPASRSRAHSSASICFFLVWVKIRLSPLSCSCTCLEWFVHIPALSLLPKSLSFSRQCGFIYVIILNLLSNLGRQE